MAYHDGEVGFNDIFADQTKHMQRLVIDQAPTPPPFSSAAGGPAWLNNAILQQQQRHQSFVHLQNDTFSAPTCSNSSENGNGDKELIDCGGDDNDNSWESARCKAAILGHPLYGQLLSAHVACLRIATPVDQLPRIDTQLAQSQEVVAKYYVAGDGRLDDDKDQLDQFMTHYILLLCSFKDQLQQHVRVHAMEAVMACWDLEQSLQSLTGCFHNRFVCMV